MSILHRCHHLRCLRFRPCHPVQIMCIRKLSRWFPSITKIKYEGIESSNPLTFKYYNPSEILMGKSMEEWLRFSVCYWHTFRGTGADQFGFPTISRFWALRPLPLKYFSHSIYTCSVADTSDSITLEIIPLYASIIQDRLPGIFSITKGLSKL